MFTRSTKSSKKKPVKKKKSRVTVKNVAAAIGFGFKVYKAVKRRG